MTQSLIAAAVVPFLLLIILLVLFEFDGIAFLAVAGISAYVAWASYWGIVAALRLATNIGEGKLPKGFLGELISKFITEGLGLLGMVLAPIALGILYGILGGGVREFLNYRRLANNPDLTLKSPT